MFNSSRRDSTGLAPIRFDVLASRRSPSDSLSGLFQIVLSERSERSDDESRSPGSREVENRDFDFVAKKTRKEETSREVGVAECARDLYRSRRFEGTPGTR